MCLQISLNNFKKTSCTFAVVVNKTDSAVSFSQCYAKQKISLACPKQCNVWQIYCWSSFLDRHAAIETSVLFSISSWCKDKIVSLYIQTNIWFSWCIIINFSARYSFRSFLFWVICKKLPKFFGISESSMILKFVPVPLLIQSSKLGLRSCGKILPRQFAIAVANCCRTFLLFNKFE